MIRRYEESDYEMIAEWYDSWGLAAPSKDLLPPIGLIVDDTVAGFLYNADGKLALLEGFISDPNTNLDARSQALDRLVAGLVSLAHKNGLRYAMATLHNESLIRRAKKFGFIARPTTYLFKELK